MRIGIAGLVGLSFLYSVNSPGMAEQNSDRSLNQSDGKTVNQIELSDSKLEMHTVDAAALKNITTQQVK